jgi:ABC-type dipeptide/oligopeptide/nickel transport system permease subunit
VGRDSLGLLPHGARGASALPPLSVLVLPTLALALPIAATLERLQAEAVRRALAEPCLTAALARGVSRRRLVWAHALRLGAGSVLGVAGVLAGALLSGSVAVELVTSWPGLGRLSYEAFIARDVHLAAACAGVAALLLAFGIAASDLALAHVDPRAAALTGGRRGPRDDRARTRARRCLDAARRGCAVDCALRRRHAVPRSPVRAADAGARHRRGRRPRAAVHPPAAARAPARADLCGGRVHPVPLAWFRDGHLVRPADAGIPLFLLGADGLGRDLFSRLLHGARRSLLLAGLATLAALALGGALGALAGYSGGRLDGGIMRMADLAIVLPALYVLLALRAALPLYVPPGTTFVYMLGLFAAVGWPMPARGVRGIIAAEREREYVLAAIAAGASRTRVLLRHLAPASFSFLRTQATVLLPAFIVAEATLSFVGLGFPDHAPSWGSLLQDTANLGVLGTAPWLVAPVVVLFSVVLGVNLTLDRATRGGAALGLAPAARREPA